MNWRSVGAIAQVVSGAALVVACVLQRQRWIGWRGMAVFGVGSAVSGAAALGRERMSAAVDESLSLVGVALLWLGLAILFRDSNRVPMGPSIGSD